MESAIRVLYSTVYSSISVLCCTTVLYAATKASRAVRVCLSVCLPVNAAYANVITNNLLLLCHDPM